MYGAAVYDKWCWGEQKKNTEKNKTKKYDDENVERKRSEHRAARPVSKKCLTKWKQKTNTFNCFRWNRSFAVSLFRDECFYQGTFPKFSHVHSYIGAYFYVNDSRITEWTP